MLSATTRLAIAVVATLMLLGGLGAIAIGGAFGASGLWLVVAGAVALVALAIERNRYRSEAAENSFESAGPGGGEPTRELEPRFEATAETFVDPTTNTTMRVFVDGRTGERRYVADA
jgi:predicted O-methyltransferase YrrM